MGHKPQKQYILDTNVLIHDPEASLKFGRHIVSIPLKVTEELDNHKEGTREKNRNTRQAIRILDALTREYNGASNSGGLVAQIQLAGLCELTKQHNATGQLYLQTAEPETDLPLNFDSKKADNSILCYALAEKDRRGGRRVILVTKDVSLRIKAKMLGLEVEDYRNEAVSLEDIDVLNSAGIQFLPASFWQEVSGLTSVSNERYQETIRFTHPQVKLWYPQQGLYIEAGDEASDLYRVLKVDDDEAVVIKLPDWQRKHQKAFGIHPRNLHQAYAMHLCLEPSLPVVFLNGIAGSGKTLIALACGLEQVANGEPYTEIIVTRATVPAGEDIGFLPGTETEKMNPWMGAVTDNLEVLTDGWEDSKDGLGTGLRQVTTEMLNAKIRLRSMSFMRGRTFLKRYIILDEAQNLTPKQLQYLLARVGAGSKVIVLGNVRQIDVAYLKETDNGLSVWANRFMSSSLGGHVILEGSERSAVAGFVESF